MNRKYLDELYRTKFDIQQRILVLTEKLVAPECMCSECNARSGDALINEVLHAQNAQKNIDMMIDLYISTNS